MKKSIKFTADLQLEVFGRKTWLTVYESLKTNRIFSLFHWLLIGSSPAVILSVSPIVSAFLNTKKLLLSSIVTTYMWKVVSSGTTWDSFHKDIFSFYIVNTQQLYTFRGLYFLSHRKLWTFSCLLNASLHTVNVLQQWWWWAFPWGQSSCCLRNRTRVAC